MVSICLSNNNSTLGCSCFVEEDLYGRMSQCHWLSCLQSLLWLSPTSQYKTQKLLWQLQLHCKAHFN